MDLLFLPCSKFLTVLLDMLDIKRPHHMVVGTGLVGVPGGGREGLGAVSSSCCFFFPPAVYNLLLLLPPDRGRKEPLFHFTHRLRTIATMEHHLCATFVYLCSAEKRGVADDVQSVCQALFCKPWRMVTENSHLLSVMWPSILSSVPNPVLFSLPLVFFFELSRVAHKLCSQDISAPVHCSILA